MFKKLIVFMIFILSLSISGIAYAKPATFVPKIISPPQGHYISPPQGHYISSPQRNISLPNFLTQFNKYKYSKLIKLEQKFGGKNKKTVLKDLKIAKNHIKNHKKTPFPFIPAGNFHGQLKKTGVVKVVFGISGGNLGNLFETLGNIYYIVRYLKLHKIPYKMAVVVYGFMASYLYKKDKAIAKPLLRSYKYGVKFYVCYNALMINHLIKPVIFPFVKTVPMGILKIYELRKKGYLYFTNP